jgi:hypothetical protein
MAYLRPIEDVKYFVVNSTTTAAFTNNIFSESFPNESFNNTTPVNLTTLSANYEIKPPTLLQGSIEGATADISSSGVVTSASSGFFNSCGVGDYLFVEDGGLDALNMLGKIASKQNNQEVTLENVPGNLIYTQPTILSPPVNNLDRTIYHLSKNSPGLPFGENASFYMVIKNPDYTLNSGLHDAIPYIDYTITSSSEDVFAYGGNQSGNSTVNPTYLAIVYISTLGNPTDGLTNTSISYTNTVPCTITPVSTLSQQFTTPSESDAISASDIPYWSVYLINPYGNTSSLLPKGTTYRIEIDREIPVKKLEITPVTPPID